jgi:hypothetical protein
MPAPLCIGAPIPRCGFVKSEVGLGKTHAVLVELAAWIAKRKAEGKPHRVAYFIPQHKLGGEVLTRADELGISAATWRGRGMG